jgi:splicing factor 3B subunit 3
MSYIVVSFLNATIVLSIGETVTEVNDSGVLENTNTLHFCLLSDNSFVQIHPFGLRHIRSDKRINEWKTPGKKSITVCTTNEKQILCALTGGELVYFELDKNGQLMDLHRKEMGNDVASLCLSPIQEGRQRAMFAVIGGFDGTVRVLSLDPTSTFQQLTLQAAGSQPSSLCIASMPSITGSTLTNQLYLYVGLSNGILMRSLLDESNGSLTDTRKRFAGTRPVQLHKIKLRGQDAILALSSRSWCSYIYQSRFHLTPLSYELLEYVSYFTSEQCNEGMVCISGNTLRIIALERLGELFNQTTLPLRYTPRKFIIHPTTNLLCIIETDHNTYSEKIKKQLNQALNIDDEMDGTTVKREEGESMEDEINKPNEIFIGAPHAGEGKWASCIRLVDPLRLESTFILELDDNEAAFSLCMAQFQHDNEYYLVVGTSKDLHLNPRKNNGGAIHIYHFVEGGTKIQLLHKVKQSKYIYEDEIVDFLAMLFLYVINIYLLCFLFRLL